MPDRAIVLTEDSRFPDETAAAVMRNRCAFTSRDMAADWPEAFTYAVILGWDTDDGSGDESAMPEVAERYGWDQPLIDFLRDAHARFAQLADRSNP